MTESRVVAVARAIAQAAAKREFGPRYEGYESSHREMGEAFAQAAIEANDAWLKERVDIAASRIKDRWMHVQPRETLSWHQVAETTVEALLWEPNQ